MSNLIYPGDLRGLTFSVVKTAEESTIVQVARSAVETRIANFQNPLWHWNLEYSVLFDRPWQLTPGYSVTEYRYLQGFWLKHKGQFESFLFSDPSDNYVGPALVDGVPNLQAQLPVVTDGETYYSPIVRNFGGLFNEDITDLNGGIVVYANGALMQQPFHDEGDYTVQGPGGAIAGYSFAGKYLQWTHQPAEPVTAEFNFLFRVRFESDKQDFEQFMKDLWAIGGDGGSKGGGELQLMSARNNS